MRTRADRDKVGWTNGKYTAAEKASALLVLGGAVVIARHYYDRSPHSGAGNCWCGRQRPSVVHPHEFTPAMKDPNRCVCRRAANDNIHQPYERHPQETT